MLRLIEKALAQPADPAVTTGSSFSDYLSVQIGRAITLAGLLAVLMIVYGTFRYATSGGDDTKTKEAKDIILGAVVGFSLLVLIKILVPLLGLES